VTSSAVLLASVSIATATFAAPKKHRSPRRHVKTERAPASAESTLAATVDNTLDSALESGPDAAASPARAPRALPSPSTAPPASASPPATPAASPAPASVPARLAVDDAVTEDRREPDRLTAPSDASAAWPLSFSIDAGLAILSQRFHSNGESRPGRLADYDYASQGVGARASARYVRSIGSTFRLGVAGEYTFAGATGVNAPTIAPDGTTRRVALSLESHRASLAVTPGAHVAALGGVDVDAEVGAAMLLDSVGIDPRAPLPSDRTIALLLGARVSAPALVRAFDRAIGLSIEAAHVGLVGDHAQTPGLEDGADASSRALLGTVEMSIALLPATASTQLSVFAAYHGALQSTRYAGPSVRNDARNGNASSAQRDQELHVSALGLRLAR
jgi:hypothetical protein